MYVQKVSQKEADMFSKYDSALNTGKKNPTIKTSQAKFRPLFYKDL